MSHFHSTNIYSCLAEEDEVQKLPDNLDEEKALCDRIEQELIQRKKKKQEEKTKLENELRQDKDGTYLALENEIRARQISFEIDRFFKENRIQDLISISHHNQLCLRLSVVLNAIYGDRYVITTDMCLKLGMDLREYYFARRNMGKVVIKNENNEKYSIIWYEPDDLLRYLTICDNKFMTYKDQFSVGFERDKIVTYLLVGFKCLHTDLVLIVIRCLFI